MPMPAQPTAPRRIQLKVVAVHPLNWVPPKPAPPPTYRPTWNYIVPKHRTLGWGFWLALVLTLLFLYLFSQDPDVLPR